MTRCGKQSRVFGSPIRIAIELNHAAVNVQKLENAWQGWHPKAQKHDARFAYKIHSSDASEQRATCSTMETLIF